VIGWQLWVGFVAFVLTMLFVDLFLVNRKAHAVSLRQAFTWTGIFASLGLLFAGAVWYVYEHDTGGFGTRFVQEFSAAAKGAKAAGHTPPAAPESGPTGAGREAATLYITGWLIEYALSMDNIFVIALIFAHFRIPSRYQHRVLFWGIIGALVLRGIMIGLGSALVAQFEWILYLFGAVLVMTAIKMLRSDESDFDPEKSIVYKAARRLFPITPRLDEQKFFTRENGVRAATPLFLVLLIVESTDVIFAVDSIPAIFSITQDPFLVFTSNVFAILGLRSLYFALAGAMNKFHLLKYSLSIILAFVGVKMLLEGVPMALRLGARALAWAQGEPAPERTFKEFAVHVSPAISLGVIALLLGGGVVLSLLKPSKSGPAKHEPATHADTGANAHSGHASPERQA
jgi:tellurite resistance protein TerC